MDIFLQVLAETTIFHCVWAHLKPGVMSRCEPYAGVTFVMPTVRRNSTTLKMIQKSGSTFRKSEFAQG